MVVKFYMDNDKPGSWILQIGNKNIIHGAILHIQQSYPANKLAHVRVRVETTYPEPEKSRDMTLDEFEREYDRV